VKATAYDQVETFIAYDQVETFILLIKSYQIFA